MAIARHRFLGPFSAASIAALSRACTPDRTHKTPTLFSSWPIISVTATSDATAGSSSKRRASTSAKSSIHFAQAYVGGPVSTPSRSVLMTGFHNGHAACGGVGQWFLGDAGTVGSAPTQQKNRFVPKQHFQQRFGISQIFGFGKIKLSRKVFMEVKMFSYVFMKILENRPERYDAGIQILSGGHANKIKEQIVREAIKPGMDVLDAGCGAGSLLLAIAQTGAHATGIDISQGMLGVAQKRIAAAGLQDDVKTINAGITELDSLFAENSFDVIVSTLVFSELYAEERALALHQMHKLLRKDGALIIAVEVQPRHIFKRMLHFLLRLPLSAITYLVAQTGTKAVKQLSEEIQTFGFDVTAENRSFLDSFAVIAAHKSAGQDSETVMLPTAKTPGEAVSVVKTIWDFVGRWFPNPVEPGLRAIGKPDRHSPVILTCNFHLTVRRVEKSLQGENVWLLAVPSNGINVWCASCGGEMNTHSIITAIKTSRLKERIEHHHIILPQFSAPGVDLELLKKETGIRGVFGPAYAKDIPRFLKNHRSVFQLNNVKFTLPFRFEMLTSMNFLMWLVFAAIAALIDTKLVWQFSALFWGAGLVLYAGYPIIPGKSGWLKAGILSIIEIAATALLTVKLDNAGAFSHWGFMVSALAINLWLGFDLRGIVAGDSSEAEWLMNKLNSKSLGHLYKAEAINPGKIQQDVDKCNDCELCLRVCPKGVYGIIDKKSVRIQDRAACFACSACVMQCPQEALSLT